MARNTATDSTRAIFHQQWVALHCCFDMDSPSQQILIESLGDVTVENDTQVEVKKYADSLTDGHLNFWKTLRNWMDEHFDDLPYKNLLLLTTQEYGATTKLKGWNSASVAEKIKILEEIAQDFEMRRSQDADSQKKPLSEVETFQQFCLDQSREEKLKRVCDKFLIAAKALDTKQLYEHLKGSHASHIFKGNQDNYLNSLFGYISKPILEPKESWAITYENFTEKVRELTESMGHGTFQFPSLKEDSECTPESVDSEQYGDYSFVKKIQDIEYQEVLPNAIADYLNTSTIVREELSKYEVDPKLYEKYQKEEVDAFRASYRRRLRDNPSDVVTASQNFYDDVMIQTSRAVSGFPTPPTEFKNGLLHSHLDEDETDKWRLEK